MPPPKKPNNQARAAGKGLGPGSARSNVQSLSSTNETSFAFAGGRRPSWMTSTDEAPVPASRRLSVQRTTSSGAGPTSLLSSVPTSHQQAPPHSPPTGAGSRQQPMSASGKQQQQQQRSGPLSLVSSLPSPLQSGEPSPIVSAGTVPLARSESLISHSESACANATASAAMLPVQTSCSSTNSTSWAEETHTANDTGYGSEPSVATNQPRPPPYSALSPSVAAPEATHRTPTPQHAQAPDDAHRPRKRIRNDHGPEPAVSSMSIEQATNRDTFFAKLLASVRRQVQSLGGWEPLSPSDRSRYSLLSSACSVNDTAFLALQQLYCLWSMRRGTVPVLLNLPPDVVDGFFDWFTVAVGSNSGISRKSMDWLVSFPLPGLGPLETIPQPPAVISERSNFVRNMKPGWQALRSQIYGRGYPPLICEMRTMLHCDSPLLLRHIFSSCCREIGLAHPPLFAQLVQGFDHDHRTESQGLDKDSVTQARRQLMSHYMQLVQRWTAHSGQHVVHQGDHSVSSPVTSQPQAQQGAVPSPVYVQPNTQAPNRSVNVVAHTSVQVSPGTAQLPPHTSTHTAIQGVSYQLRASGSQYVAHGHTYSTSPVHSQPMASTPRQGPARPAGGSRPSPVTRRHLVPMQYTVPSQRMVPSQQMSPRPLASTYPGAETLSGAQHTVQQTTPNVQRMGPSSASVHVQNTWHGQQEGGLQSSPQRYQQQGNAGNVIPGGRAGYYSNPPLHRQQNSYPQLGMNGQPHGLPTEFVSQHSDTPLPANQHPRSEHDRTSLQVGLHLVNFRSPRRAPAVLERKRYFQHVSHFVVAPTEIFPRRGLRMLQFTLTPAQIALAVSVPTGRQPVFFANGSTRYRLRACSYKRGTTVVGDSTWAISPTCWPQHIFLEFNGSPLYPRRKHHAHLDQPIELTNMLELGDNQVRVSLPSTVQKGAEEPSTYFLAIEVISTSDCETLHREVAEREHFALSDTKRELKRRLNCGSSDDVIVVEESTLRVTITDPFTSSLFTIPVRGIDCKHLECFDLGVWLETRNGKPSKFPGEPSLVDGWKCPICGHDARPVNLRVDDYFADVRANLIESGIDASDARSILVDANGDWILMQESEDNGNGTRLGPYGLSTPSSDRKTPRSFSAQTSIILDDD